MSNMNIATFIKKFDAGEFNSPDFKTQCDAGWWDWHCKDSSLWCKTMSLGKKVKMVSKSKKINIYTMYVFFKNNCPMNGSLYDDFRICDIATGDVIYTIIPRSGHTGDEGRGEVHGKENDFNEPLFTGSWKEIKNWFLKEENDVSQKIK